MRANCDLQMSLSSLVDRRIIMNRCNLILHCGAQAVGREQVHTVATPSRTGTWVPVPHAVLLEEVQRVLEQSGLQVVGEAHGLTREGARYFGLLQVANG